MTTPLDEKRVAAPAAGDGGRSRRRAWDLAAAIGAFVLFVMIAAGSLIFAGKRPLAEIVLGPTSRIEEDGGEVHMLTVLKSGRHASHTEDFREADVVTIFGSGTLDLREARMAGNEASLDAVVIAGAARVRVPAEWAVVSDGSLALGAVMNRAEKAEGTAKIVRLSAVVLAGSLEVTH